MCVLRFMACEKQFGLVESKKGRGDLLPPKCITVQPHIFCMSLKGRRGNTRNSLPLSSDPR